MLREYLDKNNCFAKYGEFCPVTGAAAPAVEFERIEFLRFRDEKAAIEGAEFVEKLRDLLGHPVK